MKHVKNFDKFLNENLNESKFRDPALKKAIGQTVKKVIDDSKYSSELIVITFKSGNRLELYAMAAAHIDDNVWVSTNKYKGLTEMKGKTISDFVEDTGGDELTIIFSDDYQITFDANSESYEGAQFGYNFN